MAEKKFQEILMKGADIWNKWKIKNNEIEIDLSNANLQDADLRYINLSSANLQNANLQNIYLFEVNLQDANLSNANLQGADLFEVNLQDANLSNANLQDADLFIANLQKCNFDNANLQGVDMRNVNLQNANLKNTILAKANLTNANLSNSYFYRANLQDANLKNTIIQDANLSYAIFINTNFEDSVLKNSIIRKANLQNANFLRANLQNVNLFESILLQTKFQEVNFNYTDFSSCYLGGTIFSLTNLGFSIGLHTIISKSESSIDFQTIRDSKNISKEFLKKIGLTPSYIDYLPDFFEETLINIKLFPVFLSHSRANKSFAEKLYNGLIRNNVQVWYDEKMLKVGDKLFEGISKGINEYDKMILICSKQSLNSWWVHQELSRIFEKERKYLKEKKKNVSLLIPITIDNHIHEWDGAKGESIRDKVIGDFSEWEDDVKFEEALNELIEALNVNRGEIIFKPDSYL